jgi:serine/threonine-protein kinase RsbT
VREWAISSGFSLVDQTKIVTAASELARNAVHYGGGGTVRLE